MSNLATITVDNGNPFISSIDGVLFSENQKTIIICLPSRKGQYDIPDSVTTIGGYAFYGCSGLTAVSIPNSVISIGEYAFHGCSGLTDINIPNSVTSLGAYAFMNCTNLTSVRLPNGITGIGNLTFCNCVSLQSINIPNSVTTINRNAFNSCISLKSIDIPSSVTYLGHGAFLNCNALTRVVCRSILPPELDGDYLFSEIIYSDVTLHVPQGTKEAYAAADGWKHFQTIEDDLDYTFNYEGLKYKVLSDEDKTCEVTFNYDVQGDIVIPSEAVYNEAAYSVISIGNNAFYGCNLTSIGIPNTVTQIGEHAFHQSTLKSVVIPNSVVSIGASAFADCYDLTSVEIGSSVISIGQYAFGGCGMSTIYIPNSVTSIGLGAFTHCTNLASVKLPDTLATISMELFSECYSLTTIDIPNSVTSVDFNAFRDCNALRNVYCFAIIPPTTASAFPVEVCSRATLHVPQGTKEAYAAADGWKEFQTIIDDLEVESNISLSHTEVALIPDEVFQLGVNGAENNIVWTSSNPSVAYANECGLIVSMGVEGNAVITATVDGETAHCNVTVTSPSAQSKVKALTNEGEAVGKIEPESIKVESVSGNPPTLNVRLTPIGASTKLNWASSDESLATIDHGIITVHGDGNVDFTTTTENGLENTHSTTAINGQFTGIEDLFVDSATNNNVYDLTGRCVITNATQEQINGLNKGVYIVNGKKIFVK